MRFSPHPLVIALATLAAPGLPLDTQAADVPARGTAAAAGAGAAIAPAGSQVLEVAGTVEVQSGNAAPWRSAGVGAVLKPGDRVRTGPASRAAVRLSDHSILRLAERTALEIQPPRSAEKQRFGLLRGLLFFFDREQPADIEFETPLAAGAIRGTEFVLSAAEADGTTRLALLDGSVELTAADASLALSAGEQGLVEPGRAPVRSPLLEAPSILQWALHYPAVVSPEDFELSPDARMEWADSLAAYRAGDLLGAHQAAASVPGDDDFLASYRAALDLSVGQVDAAESRLDRVPPTSAVGRALRELMAVVRGQPLRGRDLSEPRTVSEWLARSYTHQARFEIVSALDAARRAVLLGPDSGFAHVRLAELLLASDLRAEARVELDHALELAPRHAQAHALRGFDCLDRNDARGALEAFEKALGLDAALGQAWLGRGLAELRLGDRDAALRSLQTAAALEPRRSLYRSSLAKGFARLGEPTLAARELKLARDLDPADPTPWLYSALQAWQDHRPNTAVDDLQRSVDLNDNRRLFRSRLALDRDLAIRQANLAGIYRDAGLPEVGQRSAVAAVAEDYAGFSGHLFLANSYRALEDPNRFDLRYETARQSELLVANLLAPPEAANLSQLVSQQEHLRYFDPRPLAGSSFTEYRGNGDWRQEASAFGNLGGFAYALDAAFDWQHGQELNDHRERRDVSLQLKQRVTARDEAYLQVGFLNSEAGDVARHHDPATAKGDLRVTEEQTPNVHVGWHHAWSPASHTLLLYSRLTDRLDLQDSQPGVLFLRRNAGKVSSVSTPPLFDLDYSSEFTVHSAELQHLWQTDRNTLILGARGQAGITEPRAVLSRPLTGTVTDQQFEEDLTRFNVYAYDQWRLCERLRLIGGVAFDHLEHPANSEIAPLTRGTQTRDLVAPKAGLLLTPWQHGLVRAAYSQSLGGLYFDPSLRLEPTQIAGFNQAFRSLLPESVAGLVPGTEFEMISLGIDQSLPSRTYLGIEAAELSSDGDREVGALTNSQPLPVPDSPTSTRQTLDYRERSLSAYAVQLLGEGLAIGARYRISESRLTGLFPDLPAGTPGLDRLEQEEKSVLQNVSLTLNYRHATGFFGQWESAWYHQTNDGQSPTLPSEDVWQHNVFAGYRWASLRAELRLGLLNLTDTDYRLNPLGSYLTLPRQRTAVVGLRINF